MTTKRLLILIAISAVLIAIASLGRRTAVLFMPIVFSLVCVAGVIGLGGKSKCLLGFVGAVAGTAGILTANSLFPTYHDPHVDVVLTNMEYNEIYRSNLAEIAVFIPIALIAGAAIGLSFKFALAVRQD